MNKKNDFIQQTTDKIIESLKNGTAPFIKRWNAQELSSSLPYNPITGNLYNGINSINLMLEGYDDPRWLTYKQAQSLDANVKRGEKATLVQYWKWEEEVERTDEDGNVIKDENGEIQKIKVKLENPKVFFANVFNAEQINGLEPLQTKEIDTFKVNKQAQSILDNSDVNISHKGNRAFYNSFNDSITLPPKEAFISEGAYYATALHELGHWSGHESRLNRNLANPFGSQEYAKEELRAEIASFLLNGKLGLDFDPSQHMSYVDSWVSILEDKPTEIFKATSDATKIVSFIEGFSMNKKLEKEMIKENELTPKQNKELEVNISSKKTYLYVPFSEKDEAKKLGARWDKEEKMWFAPAGVDLNEFNSWRVPQAPAHNLDYVGEFKIALKKAGLIIEGDPIMDGKLHRVSVDTDKGRQLSGAYVGYENGHPAGYIENFKSGYQEKWKSSSPNREHSAQAAQALEDRVKINQLEREKRSLELEKAYEATAIKLQNEYDDADFAKKDHPYLVEKGVEASTGVKQDRYGNLLIPLRDIDGKQWSSQRIFSNGDKMIGAMRTKEEKEQGITYPSKKTGTFFVVGEPLNQNTEEVLVCEGYATAMSVHQATQKSTVMGVDAGNLDIVITSIKEKYPKMQVTIAADNDVKKEFDGKPNVGKRTALDIQKKYPDVKVALPKFTKEEIAKGFSDFNDLVKSRGLEEVKRQLREQMAKNLISEKATTQNKDLSSSKEKGINKQITAKKDIAIGMGI